MKKVVIVCGLIAGFILCAMMVTSTALCYSNDNFEGNMFLGYAVMLLAFSLIFVGVKNYRDKYNNRVISFGKAFQIGLYITLVASTMYVAVWLIEYYLFIPDFMDRYSAHLLKNVTSKASSQVEINKQVSEIAKYKELYKNPLFVVLLTFAEILPIGLIVSLICALLLKRKSGKREMISSTI
ncbi:MAG: DUF4199 domain-containing protein [Chitinophagaceae bacterium]